MVRDGSGETAKTLIALPLFAGMTAEDRGELSLKAHLKHYEAGEVIFEKDDPGLTLHVIISGMVKIVLPSEAGDEAILALLLPGEFFGELSLFDGQPRSASAVAMEDTQTVVLYRDDFISFINSHPSVAMSLLAVLSQRLRRTDELVSDCIFLDIPARVAKKLLDLGENFGRNVAGGVEIDLRLPQQEIASMVGTTRESVNRSLAFLERVGALKMERQKITIVDMVRLRNAAL